MAEGPINFGKPLLYLVIIGCAGAGYYAYTHWPSHYAGPGWDIDFPHKWECSPANDPAFPGGKWVATGPMPNEEHFNGSGWVTVNFHGAIDFNAFVAERIPGGNLENKEDLDIGNKTAMIFQFEEEANKGAGDWWRFQCSAVKRGDAVVIAVAGCQKKFFAENEEMLKKVVKSLRCER